MDTRVIAPMDLWVACAKSRWTSVLAHLACLRVPASTTSPPTSACVHWALPVSLQSKYRVFTHSVSFHNACRLLLRVLCKRRCKL